MMSNYNKSTTMTAATQVVLIDPVIQRENPSKPYALASTYRRDIWPSSKEAEEKFAMSKFYQKWDPRVLSEWIEYGLRELPTKQHPSKTNHSSPDVPVTLTTTKSQEVFTFLRPAYADERMLQGQDHIYQDMDPEDIEPGYHFYRPEPPVAFRNLPDLKPSVMYIFGEASELSSPKAREAKLQRTGTSRSGSGGARNGRVRETVLDCGHLVPMERTIQCAEAAASFIDEEVSRWEAEERELDQRWEKLSRQQRTEINDQWREHIGPPPKRAQRQGNAKDTKL